MPGTPQHNCSGEGLEQIINGVYLTHDFSFWTSARLRLNKFTHIIFVDRKTSVTAANADLTLDPNEFECLELCFKSALVLPNLYRSDKFLAKALKNDGKVLILEPVCATAEANYQKAIAIIIGYLMYNFQLGFWEAHEALRKIYRTKFELDRFLIMQLYEYEPILEVHRAAEEMGHSRSGERLRSVLKRTSCVLDVSFEETATAIDYNHNSSLTGEDVSPERIFAGDEAGGLSPISDEENLQCGGGHNHQRRGLHGDIIETMVE